MTFKRFFQWTKSIDSCEADIRPALKADEKDVQWHQSTDVIVTGFGGAGVSAALEAYDNGADVMVLERYNGGGSTAISGGVVYTGGGTEIQKQCGVEDDPDNMYQYLQKEVKGAVSDETLRDFCEKGVSNFDWLRENGVPFKDSLCPYKTSYPNDSYYLYYSGNEVFPPYNEKASPAPRGHRAHSKGMSGAAIFEPLRKACQRRDIKVRTQSKVEQLITDKDGQVLGITKNGSLRLRDREDVGYNINVGEIHLRPVDLSEKSTKLVAK